MEHYKGFSIHRNGVDIQVNFDRMNGTLQKAQFELDSMIMTSMVPYMPLQTGNMIQRTRAESASLAGTGKVIAAVPPYGRYQYMGKVMVDSQTGKGPMKIPTVGYRFHRGAKLVATNRDLKYSQPNATAKWFETAKVNHLQAWISKVKSIVGSGMNG